MHVLRIFVMGKCVLARSDGGTAARHKNAGPVQDSQ